MTIETMLFLAVLNIGWLYLGYRGICVLNKWVEYYGRRKEISSAPWLPSSTTGAAIQERQESKVFKVPELPPEIIAPNIRTPPKSSGFGPTGGGDRDRQPQ